ncbi:MAG: response regulator [Rickettsiales bacterium]|nr:response regulator [Rickettsiales bacterium]
MTEIFVQKKVMIVEDNPVNQKVMQKLVKAFGHDSLLVEDGFQVFNLVKSYQPDLILMDIQLIGISGIDITQNLKNDEELRSIPVIAVTASATVEDREKIVRESGCDDYLAKPFMPKELADIMSQFIPIKNVAF